MKKKDINRIEKELDEITKVPQKVKNITKKDIFINFIVSIFIIMYFLFVTLTSNGLLMKLKIVYLNIFSICFLTIAIVLFEVAYKKDSGKIAAFGVEFLFIATFTLFLPYIIFELDQTRRRYYLLCSIYIAGYYIIKAIYISTRSRVKYMNTISDVREIVKKGEKDNEETEDIEELVKKKIKNMAHSLLKKYQKVGK